MNLKTIIAPIIAVLAITLQLVFGINIDSEVQNELIISIANLGVVGVAIHGIIKNHRR